LPFETPIDIHCLIINSIHLRRSPLPLSPARSSIATSKHFRSFPRHLSVLVAHHVGKIRLHQIPQGGSIPLLPDLRAQRRRPVRSPFLRPELTKPPKPVFSVLLLHAVAVTVLTRESVQIILDEGVPDHEEEQPPDPHPHPRSSRHNSQGLRSIRYATSTPTLLPTSLLQCQQVRQGGVNPRQHSIANLIILRP
jgi:hypothetical protein